MSDRIVAVISAVCFVVAGAAVSAALSNQQTIADGATGDMASTYQYINWAFAALGGTAGIAGLLKTIWPKGAAVLDTIQKISGTEIGDIVLKSLPALLVNLDENPDNDKPLSFAITRPMKNSDVTVSVSVVPRKKTV